MIGKSGVCDTKTKKNPKTKTKKNPKTKTKTKKNPNEQFSKVAISTAVLMDILTKTGVNITIVKLCGT